MYWKNHDFFYINRTVAIIIQKKVLVFHPHFNGLFSDHYGAAFRYCKRLINCGRAEDCIYTVLRLSMGYLQVIFVAH